MIWKQRFFRIIGLLSFAGGLYAFYDFGRKLGALFEGLIAGEGDIFFISTTLASFFLGAISLLWAGMRFMTLRSFSGAWLYCALIPVTVWLHGLYNFGNVFHMDTALSAWVTFFGIYAVVTIVALFAHTHWFTPVSHEDMRHVSLEKADTSLFYELRFVILVVVLIALLFLHPAPIGETLDIIVSACISAFNLLR